MSNPADVARSYLASFETADPETIAGYVSDDFVNEHTSALASGCSGRKAYLERLPGYLSTFADLKYEVEDLVAQDGRVMVTYTMTANHDGKPINIRGVVRLVVDNGLVTHRTEYFDSLTFLRQAGLPDPG